MSLLSDIKSGILDSNKEIDSILRMCKILANNLGNKYFEEWIDCELNGYSERNIIPDYRKLNCSLKGNFIGMYGRQLNRAEIPISVFPIALRENVAKVILYQSIIEINEMSINNSNDVIYFPIPPELTMKYGAEIYVDMNCLNAYRVVSRTSLIGVIGKVKNLILNFVIQIEKENSNIDYEYKKEIPISADKVQSIVTHNFFGNISNLALDSSNFSQSITNNIQKGDFESLKNYLQEIGIDDNDIVELKNAFDKDDKPIEKEKYGQNTSNWLGNIMGKVFSGVYKISYEVLPKMIFTAFDHYYGRM